MKVLLHLAASLAAIVLIPRPAGAQSTVGNLTCFRIGDPMSKAKFQVTLGSEAGSMHCTLKAPANRACIATSGTVVSPPPPEAGGGADVSTSFLCYQARCSPGPGAASLEDAFGRRAVALVAPKSLCLPASSGGFTTTTTVVGTTTTTSPTGCRFANGECTGSCAPGMKCGAAAGTGSCECRSVSCGEAAAPECNGACAEPSKACVFSVTGCSCVRMP